MKRMNIKNSILFFLIAGTFLAFPQAIVAQENPEKTWENNDKIPDNHTIECVGCDEKVVRPNGMSISTGGIGGLPRATLHPKSFPCDLIYKNDKKSEEIFALVIGKEIDLDELAEFQARHRNYNTNVHDCLGASSEIKLRLFGDFMGNPELCALLANDIISRYIGDENYEKREREFENLPKPNDEKEWRSREKEILFLSQQFVYKNAIKRLARASGSFGFSIVKKYGNAPEKCYEIYKLSLLKKCNGLTAAQFFKPFANNFSKEIIADPEAFLTKLDEIENADPTAIREVIISKLQK